MREQERHWRKRPCAKDEKMATMFCCLTCHGNIYKFKEDGISQHPPCTIKKRRSEGMDSNHKSEQLIARFFYIKKETSHRFSSSGTFNIMYTSDLHSTGDFGRAGQSSFLPNAQSRAHTRIVWESIVIERPAKAWFRNPGK